MIDVNRIASGLARFPVAAVAAYLGLIIVLGFISIDGVVEVLQRRDAVATASEILSRLETGHPAPPLAARPDVSIPAGSPFLEGATASVAGAALLQRVAAATKLMHGNTLSSQLDLAGSAAKAGSIRATSSFEIEPASLQRLLYNLEAGMPFLFVDELVIQASSGSTNPGKLRVLLGVSGQWQGPK
ncbi:type II secretion system protein GspM [Rhodopseudomonas palustris]|uniref:Putative general secretion pathway protein M n=1 Tax=Rhodopseudomonas palustris (strain BisB18) TaxID=316056 RepID=Q212Z0_RHOPB